MIPPYTYDLDASALHIFAAITSRQRQRLLRIFDHLADDPFLPGDFVEHDAVGRPCQVKRFGDWSLTYWSEHIGHKVHILSVEQLKV